MAGKAAPPPRIADCEALYTAARSHHRRVGQIRAKRGQMDNLTSFIVTICFAVVYAENVA